LPEVVERRTRIRWVSYVLLVLQLVTEETPTSDSLLGTTHSICESNVKKFSQFMGASPQALHAANGSIVYRRSSAVVSRQISGETLVVPIRGKVGDLASIYSFNEAGSALWAALEQPASLETLADVLSQSFEVAWDEARQDAGAFVQEMQAAGLLSAVSS